MHGTTEYHVLLFIKLDPGIGAVWSNWLKYENESGIVHMAYEFIFNSAEMIAAIEQLNMNSWHEDWLEYRLNNVSEPACFI